MAAVLAHEARFASTSPPAALAMPAAFVGAQRHRAVLPTEAVSAVAPALDTITMARAHVGARALDATVLTTMRIVALANAVVASAVA